MDIYGNINILRKSSRRAAEAHRTRGGRVLAKAQGRGGREEEEFTQRHRGRGGCGEEEFTQSRRGAEDAERKSSRQGAKASLRLCESFFWVLFYLFFWVTI